MKTPKEIKIVDSRPVAGQRGIEKHIGKKFTVARGAFDRTSKTCTIQTDDGQIIVNKNEYEVTKR